MEMTTPVGALVASAPKRTRCPSLRCGESTQPLLLLPCDAHNRFSFSSTCSYRTATGGPLLMKTHERNRNRNGWSRNGAVGLKNSATGIGCPTHTHTSEAKYSLPTNQMWESISATSFLSLVWSAGAGSSTLCGCREWPPSCWA